MTYHPSAVSLRGPGQPPGGGGVSLSNSVAQSLKPVIRKHGTVRHDTTAQHNTLQHDSKAPRDATQQQTAAAVARQHCRVLRMYAANGTGGAATTAVHGRPECPVILCTDTLLPDCRSTSGPYGVQGTGVGGLSFAGGLQGGVDTALWIGSPPPHKRLNRRPPQILPTDPRAPEVTGTQNSAKK